MSRFSSSRFLPYVRPIYMFASPNARVLSAATALHGQRVNDGGCSRFVAQALASVGADFDEGASRWGTFLGQAQPSAVHIPGLKAGDVLQFEGVSLQGGNSWWSFPHHSAIVASVQGLEVQVIHQNAPLGSPVHYDTINLAYLVSGVILAYRPRLK